VVLREDVAFSSGVVWVGAVAKITIEVNKTVARIITNINFFIHIIRRMKNPIHQWHFAECLRQTD
jgi:hypothetical protein